MMRKGHKKKIKNKAARIAKFDKLVRKNRHAKAKTKPHHTPISQISYNQREIRYGLGEAQNWRCCYCLEEMQFGKEFENHPDQITTEHVVPSSKGGLHHEDNLVAACRFCNVTRGALDVDPMTYVNMAKNIKRANREKLDAARLNHGKPKIKKPHEKKPIKIEDHGTIKFKDDNTITGKITVKNLDAPSENEASS